MMKFYYCDKFFWENNFSDEQIRKINETTAEVIKEAEKKSYQTDIYDFIE